MKLPYKEKANKKCCEILDILSESGISWDYLADLIKRRKELKNRREELIEFENKKWFPIIELLTKKDTFFKQKRNGDVQIFTRKEGERLVDFMDYYANNYKRLLGVGKGVFGFIGEGINAWDKLEKELQEKNKGWMDRDDFGLYWKKKSDNHSNNRLFHS